MNGIVKDFLVESARVARIFWRRQAVVLSMWVGLMVITYYEAFIRRDFIDLIASAFTGSPAASGELVFLGALLVILWLAGYILNFASEYLLQSLGPLTLRLLAGRFAERVYRVRPGEAFKRGDLLARFISDLPFLSQALGGLLPSVLIQVIRVAAGLAILYALSPPLTALAVALTPVYYAIFRATSRRLVRASEEERRALSQAVESVKTGIDNVAFIRATLSTRYFKASTERSVSAWVSRMLRFLFYRVFLDQTFHNVYSLISLIMLVAGGYMAYHGLTTIGTVIAFTGVMYNLYEPIVNISSTLAYVASSAPYLRRYREVLSLPVEDEDSGLPLGRVEHVKLDGVEVDLDGRRVLRGVSLELRRGMVVGVVGPSGSGKTTLLLTLARLVEPSRGSVAINGRDYRAYSLKSLRSRVRYVSPHEPLVPGSVLENVTMGLDGVPGDRVGEALRLCMVDFVNDIHDTVDPGRLSEGQRQRLILARAILSDPDVLLIDEALDAVDPITEDAILSGIREKFRDRIVVVVSHRASALRHADTIYVLDGGRVVDSGTHEELYERCELYRELVSKQQVQNYHFPPAE